jgi:class 3 adenylate cyclase
MGPANYEVGEARRRLGDLRGAEEAFARAHQYGFSPEPGLSLIRLAQGKKEAAAAGIRQALSEATGNRCREVRLLAVQAEIALVSGDVETAASASEDLDALVDDFRATALRALARAVRGAVRLARGDAQGALADLRQAQKGWQEIDAPYEVAEVRVVAARALQRLGDEDAALMEARAARAGFEQLGARPAAEAAGRLLGELSAAEPEPDRVRRAFMFTDIVKSTDLIGVIGDEAWESLLAWHDQALRSLFVSHGGEVAHHTGDGFFVAFGDSRSALACAVAIQRELADHRRSQGFAPMVRIGVHAGEGTRRGQDFSGGEVHAAARIAALAEGGEILATLGTVTDAHGEFRASEAREVSLKGIAEPVQVARVEWR